MVFGGSQVLIDLEPGIKMIMGAGPLHGGTHTLAGAVGIGIVATCIGKPISEFVLKRVGFSEFRISWTASATAAFIGTLSHILLDAVMHADMHPWYPIGDQNGLLGLVGIGTLHAICAGMGVVGGIGVWLRHAMKTRRNGG